MFNSLLRPMCGSRVPVGVVLLLCLAVGRSAFAIKPEDPTVRAAVERGVAYLAAAGETTVRMDHYVGEEALAGLAILKAGEYGVPGANKDHARVKKALSLVKQALSDGSIGSGYSAVYNSGVAIMFLSALDKKAYQGEISKLLEIILRYQKTTGGFMTNTTQASGDTSMTQYAVLGLWEAHLSGVKVPPQAWENVTKWLMQTQGSDGSFTYNPGIGPHLGSASIGSAGMSGLYICANRIARKKKADAGASDPATPTGVPSVFRPVDDPDGEKSKPASEPPINVDRGALDASLERGNAWTEKNWNPKTPGWKYYYLYGIERYYAFREEYEGRSDPEPGWYTEGATHLLATQDGAGRWSGDGYEIPNVSFAILFLIRGTKMTLASPDAVAAGIMVRGVGLPTDLNAIRMQEGQIVAKPLLGPAGDLIDKIADPDDPQFARAVAGFGELVVEADDTMLSPHLVKLRDIAKSESPEARAAAITALALASGGKLDDVPTLIYALDDPDVRVRVAARDGLRFISRKFDGFEMDPAGKPEDWAAGVGKWKAWFRGLRPDADFE